MLKPKDADHYQPELRDVQDNDDVLDVVGVVAVAIVGVVVDVEIDDYCCCCLLNELIAGDGKDC